MSAIVDKAIQGAALDDVLMARQAGAITAHHVAKLRAADLLVVGALADRVRAEDVGDVVAIDIEGRSALGDDVVALPAQGSSLTGLELLREVAVARITGPRAARIRIDWTQCGLELAQIALAFGASELSGRIANKRGLPLSEGEKLGVGKMSRREDAALVKRREIEGFVRRAGRTPSFTEETSR